MAEVFSDGDREQAAGRSEAPPTEPRRCALFARPVVPVYAAGETYAAYVMTTRTRAAALAAAGVWVNSWYWLRPGPRQIVCGSTC
jgi:hypothetical protein